MRNKIKTVNKYASRTLERLKRSERARRVKSAVADTALLAALAVFTSWCAATCSSETRTLAAPIEPGYVSVRDTDSVSARKARSDTGERRPAFRQTGIASHMGHALNGRAQANGEPHDKNAMICAHRTLAFGTMVKVTNKGNGKSVTVKVTDRGPYVAGRVVDLSLAAAREIDIERTGVAAVTVEAVTPDEHVR